MATMLKGAVTKKINKGAPSSFYTGEKTNPVIQALEQEINLYVGYMKKRFTPGYKRPTEDASSRPADTLFDLWNKYEPKLPKLLYQAKVLEMGDFLVSIQEFNLALWQCYGRYLKSFGDVNVEETTSVEVFKNAFFPDGFDTEDAGFTFRALMGKSICSYQAVKMVDPRLHNSESVDKCLQLLNFLRLVTQVILPKETLCWLVYNGTIHIYSISRHLMSLGHSKQVLEYLLWASMCMESSVPLLGVRYLTWRTTLYAAVCQCYYDCKVKHHAEAFARRALAKINELSQLESLSNSAEDKDTEKSFRQATVKMAIMVYKRSVFETRRKPRGLLRPKTRANLKDAAQLPWPRTGSEKLLAEMFEGSAAQMLCILETLTDSNRRTLLSSPPAADSEVEVLDVTAELFLAAQEIIAGGGGNRNAPQAMSSTGKGADTRMTGGLGGISEAPSLIELAAAGEDGVPLLAVVRIIKLAYCFEQWDVVDTLLENTIAAMKEANDPQYGPAEKALEVLHAYDRVVPRAKHRKLFQNHEEDEEGGQDIHTHSSPGHQSGHDSLIHLAETLLSVINSPYTQAELDVDMIADACIALWNRCKGMFQKYQTGSTDNPRYLQRMDNPSKWVYVLGIVHQVLGWCGLSAVDPALTAEVVLRLALVFEASATLEMDGKAKSAKSMKSRELDDEQSIISSGKGTHTTKRDSNITPQSESQSQGTADMSPLPAPPSVPGPTTASHLSIFSTSVLNQSMREQLVQARDILEQGLQYVSYARRATARTDGKSIADISWVKELNKDLFRPLTKEELAEQISQDAKSKEPQSNTKGIQQQAQGDDDIQNVNPSTLQLTNDSTDASSVWNMVKDLHLELLQMYHRVSLKLANMGTESQVKAVEPKTFKRRTCSHVQYDSTGNVQEGYVQSFEDLEQYCRKHNLSHSLLLMQRALTLGSGNYGNVSAEQKQHLEDAKNLIHKAEMEERRLYLENKIPEDHNISRSNTSKVPTAPILLSRTDTEMVFQPAAFTPETKEKVAWYRIFARNAAGSNIKVRLNDYFLPGTGEQVPSFRCELRVSGLTPGERYVFAVAAYTADGQLIGNLIGQSTKPILASHPLPILMTWAYLSQIAYQVGYFPVAREACKILWNHFVAEPPPPEQVIYTTSRQKDFTLTLDRLNRKVVSQASPVLLRMFLSSIFIRVDISVKEGELFCDTLCDRGPLTDRQLQRLQECERLLVALELAGWLNESSQALQAVVMSYGLLAPLLQFKIPSVPVIQILERCLAVLQEIPASLRQKRTVVISNSLHHMCACITFHMAKVLRTWNQRSLASNINDAGKKLLANQPDKKALVTEQEAMEGDGGLLPGDMLTDTGSLTLQALKRKKQKKNVQIAGRDDMGENTGNEELKALEAHMLRLSKQVFEFLEESTANAQGDHELTGNEDPSILHAYIAYLPARMAYKEVVKFRRRARFLEFLVQVSEKSLTEGAQELALEWGEDTSNWLSKRNEQIIGSKFGVGKQPGALTIIGDDPKKYAAAVVEYTKDQSPRGKDPKQKMQSKPKGKKTKYKAIGVTPNMSDSQKQAQEELEMKALEVLQLYLIDMYLTRNRQRRMRRITTEEMPWRSQLNIVQGLSHFGVFVKKVEMREKLLGMSCNYMYETSFLDQEWFSFETASTLVVGWNGGPVRLHTQQCGRDDSGNSGKNGKQPAKTSGIQIAAAAATGKAPPPLYPIPQEEEDTPRTYRSDMPTQRNARNDKKNKKGEPEPENLILSHDESVQMLTKTFDFFHKAVVIAHRGHHWTLLQNACRTLWNCAHTVLIRSQSPDKHGDPLVSMETLRRLMWLPFHTAADCLLDMLLQLQIEGDRNARVKNKDPTPVPGTAAVTVPVQSWMGGVENEKGGASLKFEKPLDDISSVDTRWLRRIILRVLEMLYYEQKWERLADIALRFNAFSENRYADQVNPLLVQAQRKLLVRIADNDGPMVPQPQYELAMQELGGPVTAAAYAGLQLRVQAPPENKRDKLDIGAHIDPEGHDAYAGGVGALRLSCVPLNVTQSLSALRETLGQSHYTARALRHTHKLLMLYLAGQMNGISDGSKTDDNESRVDFVPNTACPQPTMPPDLTREEFLSMDDVQTSPLPRSQLSVVITSYEKTIEMLIAGQQKGLAAEATRELGNLHYHMGNIRGAYKWWAESLDLLLGLTNAIRVWRAAFGNRADISAALLDKCGLWGCLLGGVLASNIAQYILTSDLGLRTECCFLSGYFFKALFRSSLPHPVADRDYAVYEVGEGCEVTNLVPGIDLLSDRFRCDGRTLVAALRFVMDELARGRQNLFVLPLLTLYQYFTTFVCRDLQRSVDGRILKVRVLTDLGLFSEALLTLQRLLHGERLPHSADSHFRQVESRVSSTRFDTGKPIMEPCNLKVLENSVDKRLSSGLGTLYGPHLTCHLNLVHAHLLTAIANTIPVLPTFQDLVPPGSAMHIHPQATSSKGVTRTRTVNLPGSPTKQGQQLKPSQDPQGATMETMTDSSAITESGGKRFTGAKRSLTLEHVKGTLLTTADQILSTISEVIIENAQNDKGVDGLGASELELVVLSKLSLSAIAQQRHHSTLAARLMLSAMKIIQSASILKDKPHNRASIRSLASMRKSKMNFMESSSKTNESLGADHYQYQNFQSRSRLDSRLWLLCRLELVRSLTGEIRGMGQVKGNEHKVKVELGDVRQYCEEGITEAEACGDVESQAEFLWQMVLLNTQEGGSVENIKEIIADLLQTLSTVCQKSPSAELLEALATIHYADLEMAVPTNPNTPPEAMLDEVRHRYCEAQNMLLTQMESLGERTDHRCDGRHEYTSPVSPLCNLYLPHLLPLVLVKMRIGHNMARQTTRQITKIFEPSDRSQLWYESLGVLTTSLELCKVIAQRVASVEAEILLSIGKIQRQLFLSGNIQAKQVVDTLMQTIKTSYGSDHDLGVIRQAYLELAVVYLVNSGQVVVKDGVVVEPVTEHDAEQLSTTSKESIKKSKRSTKSSPTTRSRRAEEESKKGKAGLPEDEKDKEKRAAWVAVRCATAAGNAQRAHNLLIGDSTVTTQTLSSKAQEALPDFLCLDLVSHYVLGERKRIYNSEIEEELAPLTEALDPPPIETYEDQLNKTREATKDLSWVHVLGYQMILKRLCSTSTITATKKHTDTEDKGMDLADDEEQRKRNELDLGFISHDQWDISQNMDMTRLLLFSPTWTLRLAHLHQCLIQCLPKYADECSAIYPPAALCLPAGQVTQQTDLPLISSSYSGNMTVPLDVQPDGTLPQPAPAPGSVEALYKPSDKSVTVLENDLCLQWYQPSLEEHTVTVDQAEEDGGEEGEVKEERQVLLLYALSKKTERMQTSALWVRLSQLVDLHDRLSVLSQRGEISLGDKVKKEATQASTSKSKKQARIKALSPKQKRDEHLEALLKQCMNDVHTLFGYVPEPPAEESQTALAGQTGAGDDNQPRPTTTPAPPTAEDSQPEIPFEVTRTNMHRFEQLFDPSFGSSLRDTKMLNWFLQIFS